MKNYYYLRKKLLNRLIVEELEHVCLSRQVSKFRIFLNSGNIKKVFEFLKVCSLCEVSHKLKKLKIKKNYK